MGLYRDAFLFQIVRINFQRRPFKSHFFFLRLFSFLHIVSGEPLDYHDVVAENGTTVAGFTLGWVQSCSVPILDYLALSPCLKMHMQYRSMYVSLGLKHSAHCPMAYGRVPSTPQFRAAP